MNIENEHPRPQTGAERMRRYRSNKRARLAELDQNQSTTSNDATPPRRDSAMQLHAKFATSRFKKTFFDDEFGYACNVCDRIWFKKELKLIKDNQYQILLSEFGDAAKSFSLCSNCIQTINRGRLPTNRITNGFKYPDIPEGLPPLNPVETRLISPRIPFMAIRRLVRNGQYGIVGQVINMPMDVNTMVRSLPRQLDDDYAINVSFKRKLIHRSSVLTGFARKCVLRPWLSFLVEQPLYKHFNITVDPTYLTVGDEYHSAASNNQQDLSNSYVGDMQFTDGNEELIARQQTLLWNEENVLEIAPAVGTSPLNLLYDHYCEELSFPHIYYGHARIFKSSNHVTPYMIANSEIRRRDRRGVTPDKILFDAMRILRIRVVECMRSSFRCIRETTGITRRMIEDPDFIKESIEKNLAFLKSIPNSINYWYSRKQDLFAMMRQLGKPSLFVTLSANEMNWPHLLKILHNLRHPDSQLADLDAISSLDRASRADLINEDPVTCCLYFNKLVNVTMNLLKSDKKHNPFGKYRVIDYFLRTEFQHRGSPHAHILLWLENVPVEPVSENMPLTLQLMTDLFSVSESDLEPGMYSNQVHRHTFTCTKRGETSCRFNIPFWPMKESHILCPLPKDYVGKQELKKRAINIRRNLENKVYDSIQSFFVDNDLSDSVYLNIIRSTLNRVTVCFKRNMNEIMTNTFNPWLSRTFNSNTDCQYILDGYSCATYIADYVNKTNRGLSNLHRELVKLQEQNPELDHEGLLKRLGQKVLNTVEMSAQEAAWYLLRLPMSHSSGETVFIPTFRPIERCKSHKTKAQMTAEDISEGSTDIWTKNIIEHYEDRPRELANICLADFAAWYGKESRSTIEASEQEAEELETEDGFEEESNHDRNSNEGQNDVGERPLELVTNRSVDVRAVKRRRFCRVIRYRKYHSNDSRTANDFKREMVLLYVPFKNEHCDINDRDKFLSIYDSKLEEIARKRLDYESGFDIEQILSELKQANDLRADDSGQTATNHRESFVQGLLNAGESENFDDFDRSNVVVTSTAVRTREGCMTKDQFCSMMRTTNSEQREIILEIIHRLTTPDSPPIQIFLTGPAGCGKTYVVKAIMEAVNRHSPNNSSKNSYVACASTGKAAVALRGTTVHSAFRLTQSRQQGKLPAYSVFSFRQSFSGVKCVIVDEVSMVGTNLLHKLNKRLQEINEMNANWGQMNIIFCGDFRQLEPVKDIEVFLGSKQHIEGAQLWQSLDFFPLTKVMRQSDVIFSTILTKIGTGSPLTESEAGLIESRFRTEEWCNQNLPALKVVRLMFSNFRVNAFNEKAIPTDHGRQTTAHDEYTQYTNNTDLNEARRLVHQMQTTESAGLPYTLTLTVPYPYMVTVNIDVQDSIVNGSIGYLRHCEELLDRLPDGRPQLRVWMEFNEPFVGAMARLKLKSVVDASHGLIERTWTPIKMRTANIPVTGSIKCKRTQLPLTPACAMTIHKSQGGTFDSVVYYYQKCHSSPLAYVAMSRVRSLDGLYMINLDGNTTFDHKRNKSHHKKIRQVNDEYARLNNHRLLTLTTSVKNFLRDSDRTLIICTINAQSLVAHHADISTDQLIIESDFIVFSETWMDSASPVNIDGYELVTCSNEAARTQTVTHCQRTAGGVAIYRKPQCSSTYEILGSGTDLDPNMTGDWSLVKLTIDGAIQILLGAVYIHPGTSKTDVKNFLSQRLVNYSITSNDMNSNVPMIITGDFNTNVLDDNWLVEFMERDFSLSYVQCASPTTIRNTLIDLTFVRDLRASCMPFVAYFSDHRPLFNKINFNQ